MMFFSVAFASTELYRERLRALPFFTGGTLRAYNEQAEAKAQTLLMEHLTDEQRDSYYKDGYFLVRGNIGNLYKITKFGDIQYQYIRTWGSDSEAPREYWAGICIYLGVNPYYGSGGISLGQQAFTPSQKALALKMMAEVDEDAIFGVNHNRAPRPDQNEIAPHMMGVGQFAPMPRAWDEQGGWRV